MSRVRPAGRPACRPSVLRGKKFNAGHYAQTGAGIAQLVVLGLAVQSVAGSILLWGHFR